MSNWGANRSFDLAAPLPVRAFGSDCTDLDFDFGVSDRFALASAIIAACSGAVPERPALHEAIMELPVGARIARLLRVVAATEQTESFKVLLTCRSARCAETFEIDLPFARLLESGTSSSPESRRGSDPIEVRLPRGATVQLRCPTGRDQQEWHTETFSDPQAAVARMVRSLTTETSEVEPLDERDVAAVSEAMEEIDPLTAFHVATTCPHCDDEFSGAVDLEAQALRHLESVQRVLLHDIHVLASCYGWSESEIAAVPPARRARYVRLIETHEPFAP